MTKRKKMHRATLLGLLPALLLAVAAGVAFVACDPGDSPNPPAQITGTDDILFDEAQPGITMRVSPSTLTVPDPVTFGEGRANVLARYRDPSGNPQEGLQMNFTADSSGISFSPSTALTDPSGNASVEAIIAVGTRTGSYTLVAFTSPASGGPNERGRTTLKVIEGEFVDTPGVPSGPTNPTDQCTLLSCAGLSSPVDTGPVAYVSTGPINSSLGNPVTYRYDCGNGTIVGPVPAQTAGSCQYTSAGTYNVRCQASSGTATSDWSGILQVTVTDSP